MHGNRRYLVPIDSDGSSPAEAPHGEYALTAGHTYVYLLPSLDTAFASFHLTGYDAALVITSATVQGCDHAGSNTANTADVTDISMTVGEWVDQQPTASVVGTGWSQTNGVVAVTGAGTVGGALWNIAQTGVARHRLIVVVGATGGNARVSGAGK